MKLGITSGYYNPIHIGHIALLREAKKLVDILVVIVNNDEQVKLKGSIPFMSEKERKEILESIRYVDLVYISEDFDRTVVNSIKAVHDKFPNEDMCFFKGGDSTEQNTPEQDICKKLGIEILFNIGGGKIQSSSWLLDSIEKK